MSDWGCWVGTDDVGSSMRKRGSVHRALVLIVVLVGSLLVSAPPSYAHQGPPNVFRDGDTDGGGVPDGIEVVYGLDPRLARDNNLVP